MKCKFCNNEVDPSQLSKYASGEFCSTSCARRYSSFLVDKTEKKSVECIQCGKEIGVKKRASPKLCKCDECRKMIEYETNNGKRALKPNQEHTRKYNRSNQNNKICRICGKEKPCYKPDMCKKITHALPLLTEYFGFDKNKIGTIEVYEEFERVRNLLVEEYGNNELSRQEILEKYNVNRKSNGTIGNLLKVLNIGTRSQNQSVINAVKRGRSNPNNNYQHKHGWHTTGNGKQVFYRSSYELDYAQKLDDQQIDYEMENLRIVYGDSQNLMQRIAIPDFYLPEYGTIVEIKGEGTYDEQNMKDRFKTYKEHGYNCKLILEKEEKIL